MLSGGTGWEPETSEDEKRGAWFSGLPLPLGTSTICPPWLSVWEVEWTPRGEGDRHVPGGKQGECLWTRALGVCGPCSGHSDGGGGGGLEDSIKALTGEGEGEGERGPGLEAQGAACGGLMPTPGCLGVGETEQWPLGGIQPYSHTWMPAAPGALSKPWASPVPLPGERPAQRPTIQVRTGRWGGARQCTPP